MSKEQVAPTPFVEVLVSDPIEECLELMLEKKLHFILVYDDHHSLTGIFTLQDMLLNFEKLRLTENLHKPMRLFMSQPVYTLPAEKMHEATKVMLERGIHHLPVTTKDQNNKEKVVGVIDSNYLLKNFIDLGSDSRLKKRLRMTVYSPDGALLKLFSISFDPYDKIDVEKLWLSKMIDQPQYDSLMHNSDVVVFDLEDDGHYDKIYDIIKFLDDNNTRIIGFVPRADKQSDDLKKFLEKAKGMKHLCYFEKPFHVEDVIAYCLDIE